MKRSRLPTFARMRHQPGVTASAASPPWFPARGTQPQTRGLVSYHAQVLTLDQVINAPLGALRNELLAAVCGQVAGCGELVGTVRQEAEPAP